MIKILTIIAILFSSPAFAKSEREYQEEHCKGAMEFVLNDKTRVDCLTVDHAIEYDFAKKHNEALGQALHYARKAMKKPGIMLILTKESDKKYLDRLRADVDYYNRYHGLEIHLWIIEDYND